jgi:hypothetical protein
MLPTIRRWPANRSDHPAIGPANLTIPSDLTIPSGPADPSEPDRSRPPNLTRLRPNQTGSVEMTRTDSV